MKSQTVALAIILFLGITAGCTKRTATSQRVSVPDMITQSGCPACHVIPRLPGAVGKSGAVHRKARGAVLFGRPAL